MPGGRYSTRLKFRMNFPLTWHNACDEHRLLFLCLFLLCWRDGVVLLAVPGDARGGVHGLSVVPCLRW